MKTALIAWLLVVGIVVAAPCPKFVVISVEADDLTPEAKTQLKTGIKQLLSASGVWPVDPIENVINTTRASDTNVAVKAAVFWTRHLMGKWIGDEECRTCTQAELDAYWNTYKSDFATKKQNILTNVDVPSLSIRAGDDWRAIFADEDIAVPTGDE